MRRILCAAAVLTGVMLVSSAACGQDYSARDVKGTRLSSNWQDSDGLVTQGADGRVEFLFGEVQPHVICSPLQVCDIELEIGEIVGDVLIGDSVRWKVEPAISGLPGAQAVHLIVKPSEAGLTSSMVVTTSRRTYHIELKSHESRYMARVGFAYPDNVEDRLTEINRRLEASSVPGAGVPAEQLDFGFAISGTAPWKPTRIYADGIKTYIQFPKTLAGQDAPVLFVTAGGENRIVNYRLKGTMMVVDHYIDEAMLISGVGKGQEKLVIRRRR